jgi:hypothetical protein
MLLFISLEYSHLVTPSSTQPVQLSEFAERAETLVECPFTGLATGEVK